MTDPGDPADTGESDQAGHAGRSRWNAGRRLAVGSRVVIRRHLAPGETSHLYTDVIGHVVDVGPEPDGRLTVRRQDGGETVTVPWVDVAVLKVLPARPVRNRDIRSLEWSMALGWPGTETELVDGWLCRAGDDWSYRRGAAVPVEPWATCDDLDGVAGWYARRGLPLRLALPERIVHPERLTLAGEAVPADRLHLYPQLALCTADAADLAQRAAQQAAAGGGGSGGAAARAEVEIAGSADDDWIGLYHGTADLDPDRVRPALEAVADVPADLRHPDARPARVGFARASSGGRLVAIARGTVTTTPGGEVRVGISCVETAADSRRQGLAELISGALAEWGLAHGATGAYLHVFTHNDAGFALWDKLGLVEHHRLRHVEIDVAE